MQQIKDVLRLPKKKSPKGNFKLAVYFHNHQEKNDKPYVFWSNPAHDKRDVSLPRLQKLVTEKWKGKVKWAGLYDCTHDKFGPMLYQFKSDQSDHWERIN